MKRIAALLALVVGTGCREWPGEVEGTIKYDDCRERIEIQPSEYNRSFYRFVCSTKRTFDDHLMSQTCAHVELTETGVCTRVSLYSRGPELTCQVSTPWLGFDGKCHAELATGYEYAAKR